MNGYFLPIGLVVGLIVALVYPPLGTSLKQLGIIPWMVATIFLINGYQTSFKELRLNRRLLSTLLIAVVINLFIAPIVGLLVANGLGFSDQAALGLIVMMSVPATLSSGIVMTKLAGGDGAKALFFTISLNLIGIFSLPFMLQWLFANMALATLSPWPLLQNLLLIVLLPFVIGLLSQRITLSNHLRAGLAYIPSSCVITTVWVSLSSSVELLKTIDFGLIIQIIVAALLAHAVLLVLCYGYKRVPSIKDSLLREEWLALFFTASSKTLPLAIGVLSSLQVEVGIALIVAVLFHFVQLFVDALLASYMGKNNVSVRQLS